MKIFTDGGCKGNGKHFSSATYGVLFKSNDFKFREVSGKLRPNEYILKSNILTITKNTIFPTNIRAELFAIITALYLVKKFSGSTSIIIVTDSEFSINVCTKWIRDWAVNDFRGKKNPDLLTILFDLINYHDVVFEHVKSHTGGTSENELGNAYVDNLAQIAFDFKDFNAVYISN